MILIKYWPLSIFLFVFILYILHYVLIVNNYWKKRNIPHERPLLIVGNYLSLVCECKAHADLVLEIYNKYIGQKFCGFFQFKQPVLMLRDPTIIKNVLNRHFKYFESRGIPYDIKADPLSVNLVNLAGNDWKYLRRKLSPAFTTGKLKRMLPLMIRCADDILKEVDKHVDKEEEVNAKPLTSVYSTDVIGTCAFGLSLKPNSEKGKEFRMMVGKATGSTRLMTLKTTLSFCYPNIARILGLTVAPRSVGDYFMSITKENIEYRQQTQVIRQDFFQILIDLKLQDETRGMEAEAHQNNDLNEDDQHVNEEADQHLRRRGPSSERGPTSLRMSNEVIAAQAFVFLGSGSETVSSTLSSVLFFLAYNRDIQYRLQEEVDTVIERHRGEITYQGLHEMVYLDQIIQESQRLFPVSHVHTRMCTSPYVIPDTNVVLETGVLVMIPTVAIHRDPLHYEDPMTFRPERFVDNVYKAKETFLPFGDGPRFCIAMRFAVLEMKVFLAKLMTRFSVNLHHKTRCPLKYNRNTVTNRPRGGVWVTFERRFEI